VKHAIQNGDLGCLLTLAIKLSYHNSYHILPCQWCLYELKTQQNEANASRIRIAGSNPVGHPIFANGILRKPGRGQKLRPAIVRANRLFSSIRCKIEKVFGWWKRSAGYRRVRHVGHE